MLGNYHTNVLHAILDSLKGKKKMGLYNWTLLVFYMR